MEVPKTFKVKRSKVFPQSVPKVFPQSGIKLLSDPVAQRLANQTILSLPKATIKLNSINPNQTTATRKNKRTNMSSAFAALTENPTPFLNSKTTEQIAQLLKETSAQYYKGTPVITDDIFDIMRDYLATRDPTNPALQEIGAPTGDKVPLPYWMGSLDKIREDEKSLTKWKTSFPGDVVISDKLDGNSALLVYDTGKKNTIKMYSRGDGYQGQDISHIIPFIQGVPKYKDIPYEQLAVRGELIISKARWAPLFAKGKGANARNSVAGVMHSKNPDKELAAAIEFVAYEQLSPRVTEQEGLQILEAAEFHTVWNTLAKTKDLTMENMSALLIERRAESPYEVDGIVIFHNSEHNQLAGKNPSYAFAFKSILTHEEAEVIVTEVEWGVSKDGYLKPLIHFPPVTLAGAKIQKATGFNALFIEENTIGPGSRIVIIRSGDVIPHVHRILTPSASGAPSLPDQKLTPWRWNDTHVDAVLKDTSAVKEVVMKRMEYFAAKLEMKGVGEGIIARFYEGGIDSIPKMLTVSVEDLLTLDGFQKKSAEKVVKEIRDAVERADCLTFMHGSNLFGRSIGSVKLKMIVSKFPKILEGYVPNETELANITGVGDVTARQFLAGLPDFFAFMEEIGLPCKGTKVKTVTTAMTTGTTGTTGTAVTTTGKSLTGMSIVFTGFRNKELEAIIESRGGKVSSGVSGKTAVVVAKDPADASGKVKTALDLGIPVVDEATFKTNYL